MHGFMVTWGKVQGYSSHRISKLHKDSFASATATEQFQVKLLTKQPLTQQKYERHTITTAPVSPVKPP